MNQKQILKLIPILLIILNINSIYSKSQTCKFKINSIKKLTNQQDKLKVIQQLPNLKCITKIFPRYKWSQNMSHIQVKIQFSASSQSTTCDQVLYENKTINHNMFGVRVLCQNGDHTIDYLLDIRTFKSLDYEFAVWKKGEQNSIILQCLKSPAPYFWPILHSRQNIPKRTPKVWWDMLSKYGSQLRQVIDLLQIGDQQKQISRSVKNKKRKQKKVKQIQFYCRQGSSQHLGSWL